MRPLILVLCTLIVNFSCGFPQEKFAEKSEDCKVSAAYVTVASGMLLVSWTPPSATACPEAEDYRVSYCLTPGECKGPFLTVAPGIPMIQVEIEELFCEKLEVTISTMDENKNVLVDTDEIYLERDLPIPSDVSVQNTDDSLQISWSPIWDPTKTDCVVEYKIQYGEEPEVSTEETTKEINVSGLSPCTSHDIKIRATSNGLTSTDVPITHQIGLPAVKIIRADNSDDEIHVDFEPIENVPSQCGRVHYKVTEKEKRCFKSEYSVQVLSDEGYSSDAAGEIVQKTPGAVINLEVTIEKEAVSLRWDPPSGAEDCNIIYRIRHESVDVLETHSTSATLPFAPLTCTETIAEVFAVIDNVEGKVYQKGIHGEIDAVKDLQCSSNGEDVECSWSKPENAEDCDELKYLVTYYDGKDLHTKDSHDSEAFNFSAVSCEKSWVGVQPSVYINENHVVGIIRETRVENCSYLRF